MNNKTTLTLIASGFLFGALSDGLPHGYFMIVRFVVFSVCAYLAYEIYKQNKESLWIWAYGFLAVLFNPFLPIDLKRSQWENIDLIAGLFLIVSIYITQKDSFDNLINRAKGWKEKTNITRIIGYIIWGFIVAMILSAVFLK